MKCCWRNVYENNHIPRTGAYKNTLVEDAANNIYYFYDSAGDYTPIKLPESTGNIQTQLDAINRRLECAGILPDNVPKTDVESFLENHFIPTINSSSSDTPSQKYRVASYPEAADIVSGLRLIVQQQCRKYEDIDISAAADLLTPHGFTVEKGIDSAECKPYVLVYNENTKIPGNNRAWGWYYFNMAAPMSTIISAPHPRADRNSEKVSLWHAQMEDGAVMFMSGVYRNVFDAMKVGLLVRGSTGGTFTLSFRGETTVPIAYNAITTDIQSALEDLSTIGEGNVQVYQFDDAVNGLSRLTVQLDPQLYLPDESTITADDSGLTDGELSIVNWVDEARNYQSVLHKATMEFAQYGFPTIQYHGYADVRTLEDEDTGEEYFVPRGAHVVLSDARTQRTPWYRSIRDALERRGIDTIVRLDFNTQVVTFEDNPSSGTFTLAYDGQTTTAITYDSNSQVLANNIQIALQQLPNIGIGNIEAHASTAETDGIPTAIVKFVGQLYRKAVGPRLVAVSSLNQGQVRVLNGSNVGLAALSNGIARSLEDYGLTLAHMEISNTYRENPELLRTIAETIACANLPQSAAASYPAFASANDFPGRQPVSVGLATSRGTENTAARIDHRHSWSNDDQIAGDNYIAARNDSNSGNIWRSPTQVAGLLGLGGIWLPEDYDLVSWTYDPVHAAVGTSQMTTDGEAQVVRLRMPTFLVASIVENVHMHLSFAGADVSGFYVALYQDGNLLAQSDDLAADIASPGYKTFPLQNPVNVVQGFVDVVFWVDSSTTLPSFKSMDDSAIVNGPFFTSGSRYATADTGLTTTAPATLGPKTALARSYWVGLS